MRVGWAFSTKGMKRHLGCKAGSYETDHLLSERLILITPARAAEDLSIKASRTCNSQITLKRPPWAFYVCQLTTNEMYASISPFSSVLRKYQNTLTETKLSVYKKTPWSFQVILGIVEEEVGRVRALLEWQGKRDAWLEDGSRLRQHCHPESWRVFYSYLPGMICATFQWKRTQNNGQPLEGSVRPPSLALLKEMRPVLSGRLHLLPKAFSSHSGPTAILWDEVRCYPHLPNWEMLDLIKILLEVMRAGLELKSPSHLLEKQALPLVTSPLRSPQGGPRQCVVWALASQPLTGNTWRPGTIKWYVYVKESGEGTRYRHNALWQPWPRGS